MAQRAALPKLSWLIKLNPVIKPVQMVKFRAAQLDTSAKWGPSGHFVVTELWKVFAQHLPTSD